MLSRRSMGKLLSAASVDFLSALGIFLLASAVARHLGEEAFGVYGLIRRTGALVLAFAAGGASIALTRELARRPGLPNLMRLGRYALTQTLAVLVLYGLLLVLGGEGLRGILLGDGSLKMMKWGWLYPLSLSLASLGFAAYRGQDRIGRASLFTGAAVALPLYWALFSVTRGRSLEHVFSLLVLGGFCAFFAILFTDDWRRGAGGGSEVTPPRGYYLVSLTRSAAPGLANLFFASALWLAGGRFGPHVLAAYVGALTLHRMVEAGLRFIGIPVLPWFAQRVDSLGGLAPYRRQLLLLLLAPLAAGALAAGLLWQAGGVMLERFFQVPADLGWLVLAPLALSMPFYALYVVTRPLLDAIDRRPLALASMLAGTLLTLILHGALMAANLSQDVLAVNVACGATLMGLVNLGLVFRGLPKLRFALLAPAALALGFAAGLGLGALLQGWLS